MKMNMTKKDVIELNVIFNQLKEFGNTKFKYSILKNLEVIKPQLSALEEVEKSIKDLIVDFESDRNALIMELGSKDDKGNIFIDQSNEATMATFNIKIKELLEKHKESVDSYNTKIEELQEILLEEVEEVLSFRKINIEQCPEDGISTDQLDKLIQFNIINE